MTSLSFIPGHGQWEKAEPLNSGWSGEEKYRLSLRSGKQLLLRLNPKPDLSRRRYEYEQMLAVYDRRVIMPRPVEYGANQTHSWLLLEWIDGVPLESALPHLDQTRQYELGLEAGRALQVIHRIPAPPSQEAWESRFNRKIDRKIELYRSGPLRWHAAGRVIDFLNESRVLLKNRPQCFQHGDYHTGNMLLTPDGHAGVIDFNRMDWGDPWEEFNRIVWSRAVSVRFSSGLIDGYFDGCVPPLFWPLMKAYILSNQLGSLAWAAGFGKAEEKTALCQIEQVYGDYDGLALAAPAWYRPGRVV